MTCSYLVQVLVDVVAGDGRVGHKVEELSDRHHCHATFHKEVWMQIQGAVLEFRRGKKKKKNSGEKENACRNTKAQALACLCHFAQ